MLRKSMMGWLLPLVLVNVLFGSDAQAQMSFRATGHGVTVEAVRPDTRVAVTNSDQALLIDIASPAGIDRGVLRRSADNWPKQILIRLNLTGLESFKAGNGVVVVGWSVSNSVDRRTNVVLQNRAGETRLSNENPYWSAVNVVGRRQRDRLAARNVEVPLPAKLFDGNPREITLHWIDHYRL